MKLRLDEAARIEYAREEAFQQGVEKGRQEVLQEAVARGALLGRIEILQELLGLEQPTRAELSSYDLARLKSLAQRLRKKLRSRPL